MSKKAGGLYYFTMAMSSMYIVLGLVVLFAPAAEVMLPGPKHIVLGLILILYAVYRFYRLKKLKEQIEND
jgi:uncharacterized membrane protein